jgi:YD repeat-containing protein
MSAYAKSYAIGGGWLTTSNFYDGASSRLLRVTRTGQPGTLYAYDELGNPAATAHDVDGDGVFTAADLATAADATPEQDAAGDWWRVMARTRSRNGVTNSLGVTREQVTGLSPALLSRTVAVGADGVTSTVTRAFDPDSEVIAEVLQAGPTTPSVRRSLYGHELESAGLGSATLYGFDGFGRAVSRTVTNAAGTVATYVIVYDTLGNAVTNTAAYGELTAVTATGYDGQGRAVSETDALGNTVVTAFDSLGGAVSRSGAAYPMQYAYDTAGRMKSLATTRDGGAWDVTQWIFDPAMGLASNVTAQVAAAKRTAT